MIPNTHPPQYPPDISQARFAAHVHSGVPTGCRVALLGIPDDTGVRLNNGRAGARVGPAAFRAALARYGVAHADGFEWPKVFDAGDVIPAKGHDESTLMETHRCVTEAIHAILKLGLLPVVIGGGHDLTFPVVRAVAEHRAAAGGAPPAGIYFDAHLDVRKTVGSGMAFRRLAEDCGVRSLDVYGLNPLANAAEHVEWFRAAGGTIHEGDEVTPVPWSKARDLFVSFDLDVLDAAHAPGVSAHNPAGWTVRQAERAVFTLARDERIRCFDIMELCPPHDQDGRTARVAAHLFLTFLRGLAMRSHA